MKDKCLPLVLACEKCTASSASPVADMTSSGSAGIDILGNCVWRCVMDALHDEAPELFSCLDANVFHAVSIVILLFSTCMYQTTLLRSSCL